MQLIKNLALVALTSTVAAEFVIITSTPIPTALSVLTNVRPLFLSLIPFPHVVHTAASLSPICLRLLYTHPHTHPH